MDRRHFLTAAGAIPLGFMGLARYVSGRPGAALASPRASAVEPPGALLTDPGGVVDLPAGFSYRVVARAGQPMSDGFVVPARQDGVAAFAGPDGTTILVCNHEVASGASATSGPFGPGNQLVGRLASGVAYDLGRRETPCLGGTTTLVYDTRRQQLLTSHLSLTGTLRNCAGGPTPWSSWITCEETVERAGRQLTKDHGYCFEVPAAATPRVHAAVPLKAMGRFKHEAVAVDPASGVIYQTEDRGDGLIYRFVPDQPGRLTAGGRLQALSIRDRGGPTGLDTRNWREQVVSVGECHDVEWIELDAVDTPEDDLRERGFAAGAARFARGEGMWHGGQAVYFACTNGGPERKGQIWRYRPSPFEARAGEVSAPGRLELFLEPTASDLVENADNLTVAPWGDLILCEDGPGEQYLIGVRPDGTLYRLARHPLRRSPWRGLIDRWSGAGEFAGATFSPDGSTLFVNVQTPGLTLAITGPWSSGIARCRTVASVSLA